MENKDLITVVVPVYNVEPFLNACVDSIVNQTCRKLEILLVDDGSTDASGKVCDLWAERDPRIRVLHKENGGLSDARNAGLREAKGKYISFVDSDDVLAPTFLECLYGAIAENAAEIACCGLKMFADGETFFPDGGEAEPVQVFEGKELIRALYKGRFQQVGVVACDKLYAVDLFKTYNIEYPKGKLYEDTFTTYRLLYFTRTAAVSQQRLYGYRQRSGSIMRSSLGIRRCRDGIEADYSNVIFFREKQDRELTQLALNAFFESTVRTYKRVSAAEQTQEAKECRRMLARAFQRVWKEDRAWFQFGFVKTAAYGLFARLPAVAARLIP